MKNKVLSNTSWIIGCKAARALLSFLIGMITARYLGPSKYGLINYAASIVLFFQPIMKLGFDATLVREFIEDPQSEGKIMGTSLVFSILASLASIVGIVIFVTVADASESETIIVCFLYSLVLIFQACEMTQYWFQSKLMSKYPSVIALIAYALISIYKIYILVAQKGIRWFAVVHVFEAAIVAVLLIVIYTKVGGPKLGFSFSLGRKMLKRSKYFIISALLLVVFQQTDRIMLKLMLGEEATGFYSAAVTCVAIPAFVFAAIIESARPTILESRKHSIKQFERKLTLLFSVITGMCIAQSAVMTLLAKPMVFVLYGDSYLPTAPVLQISVWYIMFSYCGLVRDIWILAEGKQKYLLVINLVGAILNVAVNFLLIPVMGASGAALASVLTQFFANYVLCYIVKPMRPVGKMILASFNPKIVLAYLQEMKKDQRQ